MSDKSETGSTGESYDVEERDVIRDFVRLERLLFKFAWFLGLLLITGGANMARMEYHTQQELRELGEHSKQLTDHANRIMEFGIWKATTDADRYTAKDHVRFAENEAKQINEVSIRTTRLEDTCQAIKDHLSHIDVQLDRIESRINRMP